jgi:hypothetical protein
MLRAASTRCQLPTPSNIANLAATARWKSVFSYLSSQSCCRPNPHHQPLQFLNDLASQTPTPSQLSQFLNDFASPLAAESAALGRLLRIELEVDHSVGGEEADLGNVRGLGLGLRTA